MKLFEFVTEAAITSPTPNVELTEAVIVEKSLSIAPHSTKPAADTTLFPMDEGEVVVRNLSPIQRQRQVDGTPHTKTGRTCLQAPEPTLYLDGLSKAFQNPDVPETGKDKETGVRRTPDEVVKAFLES